MRRLIDDHTLSGASARLAELVRQSERFEPDAARKRSVRARLRAPSGGGFRVRGPTVAVALLCVGTAGATVGYGWTQSSSEHHAVQPTEAVPAPVPAAADSKPKQKPDQAAVVDPPRREEAGAPARAPAHRSRVSEKLRPPGEDPGPVLDAIRALRKSRDPERAQKLLDGYLNSNPRGALSEDALGLAIEAAAARGDPRAADYARRYLARFPNGRFRSIALRAVERR